MVDVGRHFKNGDEVVVGVVVQVTLADGVVVVERLALELGLLDATGCT